MIEITTTPSLVYKNKSEVPHKIMITTGGIIYLSDDLEDINSNKNNAQILITFDYPIFLTILPDKSLYGVADDVTDYLYIREIEDAIL